MSEFEAKPPRSAVERLIGALSIKTPVIDRDGASGAPELEPCHFSAMLANMPGDIWIRRTVEHLLYGKYLMREPHVVMLGDTLHGWGCMTVLQRFPDLETSGSIHRKVSRLTAFCYCHDTEPSIRIAGSHGLSRKRWKSHEMVHRVLLGRLLDAEEKLVDQVRSQGGVSVSDTSAGN